MQTLGDIGELAAIERITRGLPKGQKVIVGPGDDCAVVRPAENASEDLVLTSDPVVAGVHFDTDAAPEAVGHKAIGRALSDIAAMGGEPRWALVDVVAPASTPVSIVDGLYAGMGALASDRGLAIVGGDMAEGPVVEIHVFAIGAVPVGRALLRSGASLGDRLFATGALGGSRLGRHLRVEPRLEEGCFLRDWATAMIDISDGLASDLHHLTDMSKLGCDLNLDHIPISDAARRLEGEEAPLDHALYDGEDFELLFTVPQSRCEPFVAAWRAAFELPCADIGCMTSEPGIVRCLHEDGAESTLRRNGYAHF
ncbi:MAG: thiamine-monophosphate kinase [Verrucomicrobia bacterium]|nr:thiamine-monophosphate kinase [Verrucomicrobiota bacterium]